MSFKIVLKWRLEVQVILKVGTKFPPFKMGYEQFSPFLRGFWIRGTPILKPPSPLLMIVPLE